MSIKLQFYKTLVVYSRHKDGTPASIRVSGRMHANEKDARFTFGTDFIRLLKGEDASCSFSHSVEFNSETREVV